MFLSWYLAFRSGDLGFREVPVSTREMQETATFRATAQNAADVRLTDGFVFGQVGCALEPRLLNFWMQRNCPLRKGAHIMTAIGATSDDALRISRSLIETSTAQLGVLNASIDTIDLKALALMAFDAGLLAALIAAGSVDLGRRWYLGIAGLIVSMILGGMALRTGRNTALGPFPVAFAIKYGGLSEFDANNKYIAVLDEAIRTNQTTQRNKTKALTRGCACLIPTAIYSGLIFAIWR